MDRLKAMQVFVSIAETGSLTAAAERLNKSLPSVVRMLSTLESELTVRLFNRTTRRIALTEEGRIYLQHSRHILSDLHDADQALIQKQCEPSGLITLTAPVRFGELHLAPCVAQFMQLYPQIRVQMLLLDRIVNLLDEGIDIAVRIAELGDSSLIARPLGRIYQSVCASPTLLQKLGCPKHPQELAHLPCINFMGLGNDKRWTFYQQQKKISVSIDPLLQCNQVGSSLASCTAGVGFGRFLSYQAQPYLADGRLQEVLQDFRPPALPLNLVYPHSRLMSSRVRVLADWLQQQLPRSMVSPT